ncbi:MAG: alcohol dehydrogenase catalytic domain-containing protein, partial [Anaerolineae bacterium]|nr:alcohol dehydrogenase catalytic domain-containing protein [Anaerolineae bacterium]
MRVAVMTPSGFQIREQPRPDVGQGQVLVRTLGCGICEGDLFHYRHRGDKEVVMGHEGTGVVEAVGQDVEGLEPGDVVTALGGRYADYFVAAPRQLLAVPESLDPMLALGEPIACCVHAGGRFGIRLGDRVALVGAGFMGLVCLQLARLQGASFICALEPIPWRRRMALALGADAAMAPEA